MLRHDSALCTSRQPPSVLHKPQGTHETQLIYTQNITAHRLTQLKPGVCTSMGISKPFQKTRPYQQQCNVFPGSHKMRVTLGPSPNPALVIRASGASNTESVSGNF